ncbi:hypothetical protein WJX82_003286 [Trebouxia sp. C0006]
MPLLCWAPALSALEAGADSRGLKVKTGVMITDKVTHPSVKLVCSESTSHAGAVQMTRDPQQVEHYKPSKELMWSMVHNSSSKARASMQMQKCSEIEGKTKEVSTSVSTSPPLCWPNHQSV